jgi:predicted DNA-binding mobile mystery protein A
MSQSVLAKRLGVSGAAVNKLEHAELDGGITIAKLAQVAAALDCNLVYAIVPNTSLEGIVGAQARNRAARLLGYASRTMALEAQDVSEDRQKEALDRYARDLIDSGQLWREEQVPPTSSE